MGKNVLIDETCCAQVDLMENKSVDELCEKLSGKIDVLVNNAGMVDVGSMLEGVHSRELRKTHAQLHPAHICQAKVPQFQVCWH